MVMMRELGGGVPARAGHRKRSGGCDTVRAGLVGRVCRLGPRAAAILAVWLPLLIGTLASAQASGRYAAMVVDANTGRVLHAEAADEPRYPASLTKMMTLYLLFEQFEQGRLRPDTRIRISPEAASTAPSRLGLEPGATITVADAMKALITKSANDVAVAIAEHIAGDETRFAELMTRRAHELGMTATTFRNAHGLPDRGQVTTARDMLTLSLRLYDTFPSQMRLFATRTFQFAGRTHKNHNTMLEHFAGMEGIKTGYTTASGYNLVASVRRDGRHVLAAVFGGASAAARNARMRVLLTRGLQMASTAHTRRPLVVASREVPAARPARRPVPHRVVAAVPRPVSPSPAPYEAVPHQPAPTLVEPVSAVVRPAAEPDARGYAPRGSGSDWRSTVRFAAPVGSEGSVAASLGGQWRRPARPPSTLEAQAVALGQSPAPLRSPPLRQGRSEIQIGAYSQASEARSRLEGSRGLVRELLAAGMATPTVNVNGKTLYRARFTGLDPATAAAACSELRRRQVDCLVTQAE